MADWRDFFSFMRPALSPPLQRAMTPAPAQPAYVEPAPPLQTYPTVPDARFAQQAGIGYGTGRERWLDPNYPTPPATIPGAFGHAIVDSVPIRPMSPQEFRDQFTQAYLMGTRSPVTMVGLHGNQNVQFRDLMEHTNAAGIYTRGTDRLAVDPADPASFAHENTHKGYEMLRRLMPGAEGERFDPANYTPERGFQYPAIPTRAAANSEEGYVRTIMDARGGMAERTNPYEAQLAENARYEWDRPRYDVAGNAGPTPTRAAIERAESQAVDYLNANRSLMGPR